MFLGVIVLIPLLGSQERSVELSLRKDFRSLSTSRMWNLFKLPWLPLFVAGLGGLDPWLPLVGEVAKEFCDARDEVRENAREAFR